MLPCTSRIILQRLLHGACRWRPPLRKLLPFCSPFRMRIAAWRSSCVSPLHTHFLSVSFKMTTSLKVPVVMKESPPTLQLAVRMQSKLVARFSQLQLLSILPQATHHPLLTPNPAVAVASLPCSHSTPACSRAQLRFRHGGAGFAAFIRGVQEPKRRRSQGGSVLFG